MFKMTGIKIDQGRIKFGPATGLSPVALGIEVLFGQRSGAVSDMTVPGFNVQAWAGSIANGYPSDSTLEFSNQRLADGSLRIVGDASVEFVSQTAGRLNLGSGDWTLSYWASWVYDYQNPKKPGLSLQTSGTGQSEIAITCGVYGEINQKGYGVTIGIDGYTTSMNYENEQAWPPISGNWQHYELSRGSDVLRLFINGVLVASQMLPTGGVMAPTLDTIGVYALPGSDEISGFSLLPGVCLHTDTFDPGTLPGAVNNPNPAEPPPVILGPYYQWNRIVSRDYSDGSGFGPDGTYSGTLLNTYQSALPFTDSWTMRDFSFEFDLYLAPNASPGMIMEAHNWNASTKALSLKMLSGFNFQASDGDNTIGFGSISAPGYYIIQWTRTNGNNRIVVLDENLSIIQDHEWLGNISSVIDGFNMGTTAPYYGIESTTGAFAVAAKWIFDYEKIITVNAATIPNGWTWRTDIQLWQWQNAEPDGSIYQVRAFRVGLPVTGDDGYSSDFTNIGFAPEYQEYVNVPHGIIRILKNGDEVLYAEDPINGAHIGNVLNSFFFKIGEVYDLDVEVDGQIVGQIKCRTTPIVINGDGGMAYGYFVQN